MVVDFLRQVCKWRIIGEQAAQPIGAALLEGIVPTYFITNRDLSLSSWCCFWIISIVLLNIPPCNEVGIHV